MGEKWEKVLSKAIGVNGIHINSSLVSAQNRKRIYWTNIGMQLGGLFGDLVSIIEKPKDKGILLRDILQDNPNPKYYISTKMQEHLSSRENVKIKNGEEKSGTITTNGEGKQGNNSTFICQEVDDKYFLSEKIQKQFKSYSFGGNVVGTTKPEFRTIGQRDEVYGQDGKMGCLNSTDYKQPKQILCKNKIIKIDRQGNIKNNQDKASSLSVGGHGNGNHSDMDLIVHNMMPRSGDAKKGGTGHLTRKDGKTYCLDTGNTNAVEYKSNIRRLTPLECERLQTVADNYTNHVSDSQRYKMLGNGWTVDVIAHIFKYL